MSSNQQKFSLFLSLTNGAGLPKPHVRLVPPPLSVALDARMAGNEARFIRSGCRPNAVLRPVLCPSKHDSDDNEALGAVKFAVFALRDLKASEEVVLGWEWDDGAVVHQLPALIEEGMRSGAGPSKMTCVSSFYSLSYFHSSPFFLVLSGCFEYSSN